MLFIFCNSFSNLKTFNSYVTQYSTDLTVDFTGHFVVLSQFFAIIKKNN